MSGKTKAHFMKALHVLFMVAAFLQSASAQGSCLPLQYQCCVLQVTLDNNIVVPALWLPDPQAQCSFVVPYAIYLDNFDQSIYEAVDDNVDMYTTALIEADLAYFSVPNSISFGEGVSYYSSHDMGMINNIQIDVYDASSWKDHMTSLANIVYGETNVRIDGRRIYWANIRFNGDAFPEMSKRQHVVRHEIMHALEIVKEDASCSLFAATAGLMTINSPACIEMSAAERAIHECLYSSQLVDDCHSKPFADVTNFLIDKDNHALWHVDAICNSRWLLVQGANAPLSAEAWTTLTDTMAALPGDYNVMLASTNYGAFRLLELENDGDANVMAEYSFTQESDTLAAVPDSALIVQGLEDMLVKIQAGQYAACDPAVLEEQTIFTYGPYWAWPSVACYLFPLWDALGYDCVYLVTNGLLTPDDPDEQRAAIKADISSKAGSGHKYFHLIGDANDYEELSGSNVSLYWSTAAWEEKRIRLIELLASDGYPERNIIPTCYYVDSNQAFTGSFRSTPYSYRDWPYADTSGDDGVPDVIVTRWPVGNLKELQLMILKCMEYNEAPVAESDVSYAIMTGSTDGRVNYPGDVQQVADIRDVAKDIMSQACIWEHDTVEYYNIYNRFATFADVGQWWSLIRPDVVTIAGCRSNKWFVGSVLNGGMEPWDMEVLPENTRPVVIAASCGTGDFARTNENGWQSGAERMLHSTHDSGTIVWFGASGPTWQGGNAVVSACVLRSLRDGYGKSIAECMTEGYRAALIEVEGNDRYESTVRSYCILGDPVSPLRYNALRTTGVEEERASSAFALEASAPNPFNPATTIRYSLPQSERVQLAVYDLTGRLVRVLLNEVREAGRHAVLWNGRSDRGQQMPSGVYFCRMEAGSFRETRRMTLVK